MPWGACAPEFAAEGPRSAPPAPWAPPLPPFHGRRLARGAGPRPTGPQDRALPSRSSAAGCTSGTRVPTATGGSRALPSPRGDAGRPPPATNRGEENVHGRADPLFPSAALPRGTQTKTVRPAAPATVDPPGGPPRVRPAAAGRAGVIFFGRSAKWRRSSKREAPQPPLPSRLGRRRADGGRPRQLADEPWGGGARRRGEGGAGRPPLVPYPAHTFYWQTISQGIVFASHGSAARLPRGKLAPKPGCRAHVNCRIFGQSMGARGPGEGRRTGGGNSF